MKARYIMIGGFLGAGKTTTLSRLAAWLSSRGLKVGLITNDQGSELVDTAMLRSKGFQTEEIRGGCFCCRFNSLTEAATRLTESTSPDVFVAEPVGSCTDLVATVGYPLRRMYGDKYLIAPMCVLVDPVRAERVLELEQGGRFSEKVRYIYLKQLEEAEEIIINKADSTTAERLDRLEKALAGRFPLAKIRRVSARTGAGLEDWFENLLTNEAGSRKAMDVDYATYADGEALLGWLNCTIHLSHRTGFDGNRFLADFAADFRSRITAAGAEIAHLKMTLSPDYGLGDIATINLVRNDFVPELSQELEEPLDSGQLILNVRAEASPDTLNAVLIESLHAVVGRFDGLFSRMEHSEHFRPGKPTPTHRITAET